MTNTQIDPVMLRAQKLGLVAMAADTSQPGWLLGVVNLIDALQDQLADQLGKRAVFGPRDEQGKAPVWVDATGGDVCPADIVDIDDGHGHVPQDVGQATSDDDCGLDIGLSGFYPAPGACYPDGSW